MKSLRKILRFFHFNLAKIIARQSLRFIVSLYDIKQSLYIFRQAVITSISQILTNLRIKDPRSSKIYITTFLPCPSSLQPVYEVMLLLLMEQVNNSII